MVLPVVVGTIGRVVPVFQIIDVNSSLAYRHFIDSARYIHVPLPIPEKLSGSFLAAVQSFGPRSEPTRMPGGVKPERCIDLFRVNAQPEVIGKDDRRPFLA